MAQAFDIVFAFKKQFDSEIAAKTISALRHHPPIWEFISQESNYLRIDKYLHDNSDIWSVNGVIRFIISRENMSAVSESPMTLSINVDKIASRILEIENLLSHHSWREIVQKLPLSPDDKNEIRNLWGAVFTYFLHTEQLAFDLEQSLLAENEYTLQILAHLIKIQTITDIPEFVDRHAEQLEQVPEKVNGISDALRRSGAEDIAEKLVRSYLEHLEKEDPSDQSSNLNEQKDTEKALTRFISISALAESIGNQAQSILFQKKAQELLEKKLERAANKAFFNTSLLEKAAAIQYTDHKAAQGFCKLWLSNYLSAISQSSSTALNYSEIEKSVKLFTDLGLQFEAIEFLEKLSKTYGKNEQLERLIGDISSSAGDQARAIRYYKPLFGENKLTRSQTIDLANAFVYTKSWQSAADVLSTVNILSVSEAFLKILCDQKEDLHADLEEQVSGLVKEFSAAKSVELLAQLLNGVSIKAFDIDGIAKKEMNLMVELVVDHLLSSNRTDLLSFLAEIKNWSENAGYQYFLLFSDSLPHSEADALLCDLFLNRDFEEQEIFENVILNFFERGLSRFCEELLLKHHYKWPLSKKLLQVEIALALENKDFTKAGSLVEKLISIFPVDNDVVTLYGTYILRSTLTDFPFSYTERSIAGHEKVQFAKLLGFLEEEQISGANQILKVEILRYQKTRDYLALGVNYSENSIDEKWRIPFSIGCHYYKEKKFDQAIIFLAQSRKISRKSSAALKLLVESYNHLKLFDEAVELIREEINQNRIPYSDLKSYVVSLFNSNRLMDYLSENQQNPDDQILFDLLRIRILIARGLPENATELLDQTERKIPFHDSRLLEVGDLFHLAGEDQETKRVLDKFLSNNQDLDDSTIIRVSGMFFQTGSFEKSLNILSLVNHSEINSGFARAANLARLDEFDQAQDAVLEAIIHSEKQSLKQIAAPADIPEEWVVSDLDLLAKVIVDQIKKEQRDVLQPLFAYLIDRSANDNQYFDVACYVAEITGDGEFSERCILMSSSESEDFSKRGRLLKMSNALINNYELEAAILADEISKESSIDPTGKLLQARFHLRQGEESTSKQAIAKIHQEFMGQQNGFDTNDTVRKIKMLAIACHLCDALIEIVNYQDAYQLAKWVIQEIGFTDRISKNYLDMLFEVLRENKIDEMLQIKNHSYRFDDVDREIFSRYLNQTDSNQLDGVRISEINDFFVEKTHPFTAQVAIVEHEQNADAFNGYDDQANIEIGISPESKSVNKLQLQKYSQAVFALQKEPARSLDLWKSLLKEDPNNPRYLFALGWALKLTGDNQGSYPLINLALEIWPDEFEWHRIAADLCEQFDDNLNAARHRHAIALHHSPESGDLRTAGSGKRQALIEEFVNKTGHIPHRKIPELIKYARESLGWGDITTANAIISRIREYNPSNMDMRLLYAEILLKNKQLSEAEAEIRLIMHDFPSIAEAIILLARLEMERGYPSQAVHIIDEAIRNGTSSEDEFLVLKFEALEKEKGSDEAITFLRDYCNDHHDPTILRKAAKLMLDHGEVKTAEKYIEGLIGSDSEDAENLLLAGLLSSVQGDLDKALNFFNLLITKYPFREEGYIQCAKIFEIKRQFDFAQRILEEGIKNNPDNFSLLKFTGLFLFNAGKTELARGYLERAYTMNRNDLELKELQKIS